MAPGFEQGVAGMAKGGVRYIARAGCGLHARTGSEAFHQVTLYKMRRRERPAEEAAAAPRADEKVMRRGPHKAGATPVGLPDAPALDLALEAEGEEDEGEGRGQEDDEEREDHREASPRGTRVARGLPTSLEALFSQDGELSVQGDEVGVQCDEHRAQARASDTTDAAVPRIAAAATRPSKSLPTVRHGRSAVRSSRTARVPHRAAKIADGAAPAAPACDCILCFFGLKHLE